MAKGALRNHRRESKSHRYNAGNSKREKKKQKVPKRTHVWYNKENITLQDLKEAFPDLHTRDALAKLAELRGD